MNATRRAVVFVFFPLVIILSGLLFWPFILNEIIKPVSLVVWLLLRIFVLSIDQKYYWAALIFAGLVYLYRLLIPDQPAIPPVENTVSNKTINTIEYWRRLLIHTGSSARYDINLKRELAHLLASLYATMQSTTAGYQLYDAMQRGEIPLPETIHKYLFSKEPPKSGRSIKNLFLSMRETPRKWIRRWSGQEEAEHYRMIDEVLSFMETSLEMKNDNGKFNPTQH